MPHSSRRQAAIRLLACICAAVDPIRDSEYGPDIVGVVESQMKLQALDFWMRYPDYLANELLNEFDQTGDHSLAAQAASILDSREPELRRFPMVRYLFGAFEPLDDALSVLSAYDFVRIRRKGSPGQHIQRHIYLLTKHGRSALERLIQVAPELDWYKRRAELVTRVAGAAGGAALKDRQYVQAEYSDTRIRSVISPITDRVRVRLEKIKG
jgi:hypothetical protein